MLRHFMAKAATCRHQSLASRRAYAAAAAATSREKRALNKQQLQGSVKEASAAVPTSATTPASAPASAPGQAPATASGGGGGAPSASGGGGGGAMLGLLAVVGAGGALAYYNGMIPGLGGEEKKEPKKKEEESAKAVVVADDASTTSEETESTTDDKEDKDNGSVTMDKNGAGPAEAGEVSDEDDLAEATAAAAKDEAPAPGLPTGKESHATVIVMEEEAGPPKALLAESKIMEELEKVKAQLSKESDRALSEAHSELAKLSILNLDNLDDMTTTQLKVRLVQMAKEMEDRTKWEAVRLQEFLHMKEKEVEDKYVLMIKKLRMEAENLMEERLAEQRKLLTKQAEEALQEQQNNSDAFIESSLKIQEQSFNEERAAFEKKVEEAMNAKYEELYGKSLAKVKEEYAAKMDKKVKQMESLSQKLADLETSLKSSRDFQEGSVQAHRITAAALALTEKLESGQPAGAAISTLKAVASDNPVVTSAVDALPSSVALKGVLTLQEIQAGFEEEVYPQCRRATSVPAGQSGLEGQLMGMLFSKLKYPPAPDDPAPESEKDAGEYVLARARRHVQLGELEEAVTEMDKLKGQASFVAKDWEENVKARVAVEKALKVIKMECALANESLSRSS